MHFYFLRKSKQLSISELARSCDISRTTAYNYKSLLEV
ncbi:MAG: HTH domain-containing protein [Oscillospiraceae bacterium]|nr:HTH domain-containing protein [Oscillospiraceae bacterium]